MPKILLLDDNKDLLEMLCLILQKWEFEISGISDWRQLDSSIKIFDPDIVILDILLGGADGRVLCKQLKTDKKTRHIPVLLISANFEMGKSIPGFLADGFIIKPFETIDIVEKINTILSVYKNVSL